MHNSPLRRRVLIIHNPSAGSSWLGLFASVQQRLKSLGVACEVREIKNFAEARELSRSACLSGNYDDIVVAGGDGTIAEVANGMIGSEVPLGIIPTGTANVLAHEIGLARDTETVARTLAFSPPRSIYPGLVNGRIFLLMVSAGFDSRIVAEVTPALKDLYGKVAYLLVGLKHIAAYAPPSLTVTVDGTDYRAAWAIVSKARHYGGKFLLAAEAGLAHPEFIVSLFAHSGRLGLARDICAIGLNRASVSTHVKVIKGTFVAITSDSPEPAQADGDAISLLPLSISLSPQPLQLIMPGE